jgi:hypothetical protein
MAAITLKPADHPYLSRENDVGQLMDHLSIIAIVKCNILYICIGKELR